MKMPGVSRFAGSPQNLKRLVVGAGLVLIALLLAAQGYVASRAVTSQEDNAAQIEKLAQSLNSQIQKYAKDFYSATVSATGDVPADLVLAREKTPNVSELKWWTRASLDEAYASQAIASSHGFSRLADAERLMAGNEKVVSVGSFARFPKVQDPVLVLSARHADRVVQVLRPSSDVLEAFRKQAPEGVVVALVQDGQVVAVNGATSLDLSALDVVSAGAVRLSLAYLPPPPTTPWLGALPLQWMASALLALLGVGVVCAPHLRRGSKNKPKDHDVDDVVPSAPVFRPATISALPSSQRSSAEHVGAGALPAASTPDFSAWFTSSGLVFEETSVRSLPDSSQTRTLVRALVEQLGGLAGKRVVLATDGRALSESLAKWATESFLGTGAHVLRVQPLPLSSIPFLFSAYQSSSLPAEVVVWFGDGREDAEASGMHVYQASGFWSSAEYSRWRLRMTDVIPSYSGVSEGEVSSQSPDTLVPGLIDRFSITMQVERPIRVVVDFGNGPAAPLASEVWESVGIEVVPLHGEVDSTFPNRLARSPSGWSSLSSTIRQFRADFGAGLSVDGRSFVIFNEDGQQVPSASLIALLSADVLSRHPGAKIEFSPDHLDEEVVVRAVRKAGGIPSPRSDLELNNPLSDSVELCVSASIDGLSVRFREDLGAPDALYAVSRLAILLSMEDQSLAARLDDVLSSD